MDEPTAYYTEWSKSEKERQISYINTHIWNLERWYWWTYLQGSKGDTDIKKSLLVTVGEGEAGMTWETSVETYILPYVKQISSVLSLSRVQLFVAPWTAACQAPFPSPTPWVAQTLVISNHLILCYPLLLLLSIFPRIRVFSNESVLHIRWPEFWRFSFSISISPSNEHPGLISFRMDWLDLLAVQGTLKSLLLKLTAFQIE